MGAFSDPTFSLHAHLLRVECIMQVIRILVQLMGITMFLMFISLLRKYDRSNLAGSISQTKEQNEWVRYRSKRPFVNELNSERLRESGVLNQSAEALGSYPGNTSWYGSDYKRALVVSCVEEKDLVWIAEDSLGVTLSAYIVNGPTALKHPPLNKGNEVMTYLTYIIDHYNELPEIVIFMHSHRWAIHNNELLDYDAAQMIQMLRSDFVIKEGYINMRCDLRPGCPEWLYSNNSKESLKKQEEAVLSKSWSELFPFDPMPPFLGQPCCGQFALSRERILSIPLSQFIFYRDWILTTPLSNYISGRIWEYSWQFVFTGRHTYCPTKYSCYCYGFGVCFDGKNVV